MTTSISKWMRGAALGAGAAVMVAMAPGIASAGTVSETISVPTTATNWTQTLNFAGFDSFGLTGQTLDSVSFQLTETMAGTAFATNNGGTAAVGDFVFTNIASVNAGTFGQVVNVQNSSTITIAPGDTSPTQDIDGSNNATTTLTTDLAQFLPAFTGSAADNGSEGLSFTGGNLAATFTDSGALSVLVTYTYSATPVPEPASMALLAMGLLGLGFVKFKRA